MSSLTIPPPLAGRPEGSNDGCCLTLLVSVRSPLEESVLIDGKYSWREVRDQEVGAGLAERMGRNKTVPLVVIR